MQCWLRRARQNLSCQGEALLNRAAEAGKGGDATESRDHMSCTLVAVVCDVEGISRWKL